MNAYFVYMMKSKLFLIFLVLLFALLFGVLNYFLYFEIGQQAYTNDDLPFGVTFRSFFVFNFLYNLTIKIIKWFLFALLLFGGLKILKNSAMFIHSLCICVIAEFVFLIPTINTLINFWGRSGYGVEAVRESSRTFQIGNIFSEFNDVPVFSSISILTFLYYFLVALLISGYANLSQKKALILTSSVFIPPYIVWMIIRHL